MDTRAERLLALVLKPIAYGDSDVIALLLGRVSAFARGARSSQKRFGSALESRTRRCARTPARTARSAPAPGSAS